MKMEGSFCSPLALLSVCFWQIPLISRVLKVGAVCVLSCFTADLFSQVMVCISAPPL